MPCRTVKHRSTCVTDGTAVSQLGRRKTDGTRPTFDSLLKAGMSQTTKTKAWCSDCADYRQLSQQKVSWRAFPLAARVVDASMVARA